MEHSGTKARLLVVMNASRYYPQKIYVVWLHEVRIGFVIMPHERTVVKVSCEGYRVGIAERASTSGGRWEYSSKRSLRSRGCRKRGSRKSDLQKVDGTPVSRLLRLSVVRQRVVPLDILQ